MKVNANEMNEMIIKTYEPGHEMVKAMNQLYELVNEHGLRNDPKYIEVNMTLTKCMIQYQDMGMERGMEICKQRSIIDAIKNEPLGKHLVKRVMKKLED